MARDSTVFVLGEDVGHITVALIKLPKTCTKKYGEIVIRHPIAENSFTGMAVETAMTGLRPIIEGMNMGFCCLPSTRFPTTLECCAIPPAATSKFPW